MLNYGKYDSYIFKDKKLWSLDPESAFRLVAARLIGADEREAESLKHRNRVLEYQRRLYERAIVVTPYGGFYGHAGVVIAIDGSPPRGLFIVPMDAGRFGAPVFYTDGNAVKKLDRHLRTDEYWTVVRFVQHLGFPVSFSGGTGPIQGSWLEVPGRNDQEGTRDSAPAASRE